MILNPTSRNKSTLFKRFNRIRDVPGIQNYPEVLLNNHLGKELQQFLKPSNLVQNLFLLPKYNIRDNFITSNDLKCKMKSFVIGLLILGIIIYHHINIITEEENIIVFESTQIFSLINSVSYILNLTISGKQSIFYSKDNVEIIILIKEIQALIKVEEVIMKKLILWNRIYVAILAFSTYIIFVVFHIYYNYVTVYDFVSDTLFTIMHLNVMYTIAIFKLLRVLLEEITKKIEAVQNSENHDDVNFDELYSSYEKFLKAYNIHVRASQYLVSSFKF